MKQIYKTYIDILYSFVHDTIPEFDGEQDYIQLIKLAKINSTEGIVNSVLMKNTNLVDSKYHEYIRKQCLKEIYVNSQRIELAKSLISKLDEQGIDHLIFKGFIIREYYSIPELRTFGDIDIVVHEKDRKKCDELMTVLGYETRYNWEPVYTYFKDAEYYEIHTDIMEVDVSDKADYKEYYSHIWKHTRLSSSGENKHSYEFVPEFHFLYMLTHIAKHISSSGAGIRMYLDIAFFIKHFGESIDWDWILGELTKLRLQDFANIALTAVKQWFGVKSPFPLRNISEAIMNDFLDFVIEGGVYGKYGRDKNVVFLKQQNRNEEKISKFKTLMSHIFPAGSSLENHYSYLKKHRWLLPVAWVHRVFGNVGSWKRYIGHTRGIIMADTEEALRLKQLYKEIGL